MVLFGCEGRSFRDEHSKKQVTFISKCSNFSPISDVWYASSTAVSALAILLQDHFIFVMCNELALEMWYNTSTVACNSKLKFVFSWQAL